MTTEIHEYQPHFNKCVTCGQEPKIDHCEHTDEVSVTCPGVCYRLSLTCKGFQLAAMLWNAANPANVSHATAFSENPEIHEWKHGGEHETPLSYQVGGDHYRNLKIQPIELFQKTGLDFELANAMKYVIRYKRKNGIEDLQKAKQYLDFYAARWKPLNDFVNAFFRQFDPKTRFLLEEILFGNFESAKMLIDQLEAEYKEAAQ